MRTLLFGAVIFTSSNALSLLVGLVIALAVLGLIWVVAKYILGQLGAPSVAMTVMNVVLALFLLLIVLDFVSALFGFGGGTGISRHY